MITILFPSEYNNISKVDDNFKLEYNACKTLNLNITLFDHDQFVSDNKLILSNEIKNSKILLRSWMLKPKEYYILNDKLNNKLLTNYFQYKYAHYFPEIFQDIKKYTTPINCWFPLEDLNDDVLVDVIQKHINTDIIIKDYVKSEKGTDLFIIKKDDIKTNLKNIVNKFVEQRQPLFNEGIVLKEFVNLKKYNGITNEWRAFFYKKELISLTLNSEQKINSTKPNMGFVKKVGSKINKNDFYTIDFAELENESWKVLEAGDGQVSGLSPYQNELDFYSKLKTLIL